MYTSWASIDASSLVPGLSPKQTHRMCNQLIVSANYSTEIDIYTLVYFHPDNILFVANVFGDSFVPSAPVVLLTQTPPPPAPGPSDTPPHEPVSPPVSVRRVLRHVTPPLRCLARGFGGTTSFLATHCDAVPFLTTVRTSTITAIYRDHRHIPG